MIGKHCTHRGSIFRFQSSSALLMFAVDTREEKFDICLLLAAPSSKDNDSTADQLQGLHLLFGCYSWPCDNTLYLAYSTWWIRKSRLMSQGDPWPVVKEGSPSYLWRHQFIDCLAADKVDEVGCWAAWWLVCWALDDELPKGGRASGVWWSSFKAAVLGEAWPEEIWLESTEEWW